MPATDVKYIVVHYTANPGSSATANRNYFNNPSANIHGSSSHFIVGLQGEVIQCIPTDEVAYANYPMNFETISIEVCHPDSTGKYNDATYRSVIRLVAWLCSEYHFDTTNVIRHYDVHRLNGYPHEQCKNCPKYYVEHPDAWEQLLSDVNAALGK
jgi:N-acetylmuramoyl-L-alanine amidase CwlA